MLHNLENTGRWFDPLRQMRLAQRDMSRLFDNLRLAAPPEFPLMNIWAGADGAVVTARYPALYQRNSISPSTRTRLRCAAAAPPNR